MLFRTTPGVLSSGLNGGGRGVLQRLNSSLKNQKFVPGKISVTVAVLFFTLPVFSQAPDFIWAKGLGGTGSDYSISIAIDASGNTYTTGVFSGTVDFDPGAGVFHLTA